MEVIWNKTKDCLPNDGDKVLIVDYLGNIVTAHFRKGISTVERKKMKNGELYDEEYSNWDSYFKGFITHKRSDEYRAYDQTDDNEVPYAWLSSHQSYNGQDIEIWANFPEFKTIKE